MSESVAAQNRDLLPPQQTQGRSSHNKEQEFLKNAILSPSHPYSCTLLTFSPNPCSEI